MAQAGGIVREDCGSIAGGLGYCQPFEVRQGITRASIYY